MYVLNLADESFVQAIELEEALDEVQSDFCMNVKLELHQDLPFQLNQIFLLDSFLQFLLQQNDHVVEVGQQGLVDLRSHKEADDSKHFNLGCLDSSGG